jgi:pimeloyl-ACP methyl ester carboxylesterase
MEAKVPYHPLARRLALLAATAAASLLTAILPGTPASAAAVPLPVNFNFIQSYVTHVLFPNVPPPGANNFACKPSAAHPFPVILVHGTIENQNDNWQAASPILANHGYCVFSLNYGGASANAPLQGTGDIAASAGQLSAFVNQVLAATGAPKVDIVGHSQGGMMPRFYLNFLGGAGKVDKLVGLAPSNFGTTLDGLTSLGMVLGLLAPVNVGLTTFCTSCVQQEVGSAFLQQLNQMPTVPGVQYTVIETKGDEVVTPFRNAFLPAAANVTNILVQDQCPLDASDHVELANDPIAMQDMLNALDPANPVQVHCQVVLPLSGPVSPVPPF